MLSLYQEGQHRNEAEWNSAKVSVGIMESLLSAHRAPHESDRLN